MPSRRLIHRVVEALLVLLGLVLLFGPQGLSLIGVCAWDVLAIAYVVLRWVEAWRLRGSPGGSDADDGAWLRAISSRRAGVATTLIASVVGVGCGLTIAASRTGVISSLPDYDDAFMVAAVPAIIAAWFVLHLGFTERYAHLYYRGEPKRGLDFPATERPNLLDFTYFSYTVGTNLAASDVSVTSRPMRYTVLVHQVISFFYNVAVLGVAIAVLNGG